MNEYFDWFRKQKMSFNQNSYPWYSHPSYNRYWEHYSLMTRWLQHHAMCQNSASSAMLPPCPGYMEANFCQETHGGRRLRNRPYKKRRGNEDYYAYPSSSSTEDSSSEDDNAGEFEFELEVTDEMLAMMDISKKYRRERDRKKKEESRRESNVEYVELGSIKTLTSEKLSTKRPRKVDPANKMLEMRLLYGDKAPVIYGMETAMNLSFNRACDLNQPRLWPVIPVRL